MLKKYALEIYLPGNRGYDIACFMESNDPFLPVQKGELINPHTWTSHYASNLQASVGETEFGIILRVSGIEHFIVQTEEGFSQHKLGIFTEALDDVAQSRP